MRGLASGAGGRAGSDFQLLVEMLLAEHQRVVNENRSLRETASAEEAPTARRRSTGGGHGGRASPTDAARSEPVVAAAAAADPPQRVSFVDESESSGEGGDLDAGSEGNRDGEGQAGSEATACRDFPVVPTGTRSRISLESRASSGSAVSRMTNTSSSRTLSSTSGEAPRRSQSWRSDRARLLEKGMERSLRKELQETLYEKFGVAEGAKDIEIDAEGLGDVLTTCSTEHFDGNQLEELIRALIDLTPKPRRNSYTSRINFPKSLKRAMSFESACSSSARTVSSRVLVQLLVSEETYWSIPENLQPLLLRVHRCLANDTPDAHQLIAKLLTQGSTARGLNRSDLWNEAKHDIFNPETIFKVVSGLAVVASSVLVGVATAVEWDGWPIVEACIALYFLFELMLKLKLDGCQEFWSGPDRSWNAFDAVVTVVSLADAGTYLVASNTSSTGGVGILRSLRMVRAMRVLRLLRMPIMKQLALLLDGFVEGLRTLFWAGVLLLVLLYILAVMLTQITSANEVGDAAMMFSTVPRSMDTLFRCLVAQECSMPDGKPIASDMAKAYGWRIVLGYWLVVSVMHFGIVNLVNAIFVENTIAAARLNQDKLKRRRISETRKVAKIMLGLVKRYTMAAASGGVRKSTRASCRAGGEALTRVVFNQVNDDPETQAMYDELGIAEDDRDDLFDTLDIDGNGELSVYEVVQGIMQLRGPARRSDAFYVKMVLRSIQKSSRECYLVALRHMDTLEKVQEELRSEVYAQRDDAWKVSPQKELELPGTEASI